MGVIVLKLSRRAELVVVRLLSSVGNEILSFHSDILNMLTFFIFILIASLLQEAFYVHIQGKGES